MKNEHHHFVFSLAKKGAGADPLTSVPAPAKKFSAPTGSATLV